MKGIIRRTSLWGDEEKPVDEAVLVNRTLHYLDKRTASSLEEAKETRWYNEWISSGSNHREENGYIVREVEVVERVWEVEIDSLIDIISLFKKYGDIIIKESAYFEYEFEIEIYDTYRE